jgi:hypothetical protein
MYGHKSLSGLPSRHNYPSRMSTTLRVIKSYVSPAIISMLVSFSPLPSIALIPFRFGSANVRIIVRFVRRCTLVYTTPHRRTRIRQPYAFLIGVSKYLDLFDRVEYISSGGRALPAPPPPEVSPGGRHMEALSSRETWTIVRSIHRVTFSFSGPVLHDLILIDLVIARFNARHHSATTSVTHPS